MVDPHRRTEAVVYGFALVVLWEYRDARFQFVEKREVAVLMGVCSCNLLRYVTLPQRYCQQTLLY